MAKHNFSIWFSILRFSILSLLLCSCADNTNLVRAAKSGDAKEVSRLLSAGENINGDKNNIGMTPLHAAASSGNGEVVELLLNRGAKVNIKGTIGQSPLHEASYLGSKDVAELLIAKGADINAKTNSGLTPLHAAAEASQGGSGVAELLINHGADVNAKDNYGSTPLHVAVQMNHKDIAGLLIAKGAEDNLPSKNELDRLDFDIKQSHNENPVSVNTNVPKVEESSIKQVGSSLVPTVKDYAEPDQHVLPQSKTIMPVEPVASKSVVTTPGMHLVFREFIWSWYPGDGDTIYTVTRTDGSQENLKVGYTKLLNLSQGQQEIGGLWQFESSPVALFLGYIEQINYVTRAGVGTGNIARFQRHPMEILAYYTGKERLRIGGGISRDISSSAAWAEINGIMDVVTFDKTTGLVAEIGYHVWPVVWINFRMVSEQYRVISHTSGGITTPWSGSSTYSGNHSDVILNIEF